MATRKSRLETQFTGDDKPFQRVAARVKASVTRLRTAASSLQGGFAFMGGGMLVKSTIDQADRIGKLATRFDVSAEALQRLGHVADLGGSDLEAVAKGLGDLNKRAKEAAVDGLEMYNREFESLGIDAQEFWKLDHEERWLAMSDAIRNATNRNEAMAASEKLMGRAGKELFQVMEQSRETQIAQMDQINTLSDGQIDRIEELKDHFTTLTKNVMTEFAKIIVQVWEWIKKLGDELGRAGALIAALFDPHTTFEDVNKYFDEVKKEREEQAAHEKKLEEDRKARQKEQQKEIEKRAKKAAITATVGFTPSGLGGFFGHSGKSGVSPMATKSLAQKNIDLQNSILNELKHSRKIMQKATT
jgi:hypothetical protein